MTSPSDRQQPPNIIPSKRWPFLFLLLALLSAYLCLNIQMDNRFHTMLDPQSEEARVYEEFLDTFGNDEFIILGISGKPLFEDAALDAMLQTLEALEAIPLIKMVNGIPTVYRDRFGAEDPEALREEILSAPFYQGLFINADATIAGLLIDSQPLTNPEDRRTLVEAIEVAIHPLQQAGFRTDLIGSPVFNVNLSKLSMKESLTIFPIAAILSFIVLIILMRSLRAVLTVVLCGAITLLYTISLVPLAGLPLNVVTSMLPIILWVLSVANCIHLVCRYQYHRRNTDDAREALNTALHEVRRACILSSITTALGFISLTLADIPPVAQLGYLMSIGLIISLAVNLLLGSNLLLLMNVPPPRGNLNTLDPLFQNIAKKTLQHRVPVLALSALLTLTGAYCITQIKSDADPLNFIPKDSQTNISYNYLLDNLTGAATIEIQIDTPEGWLNDQYWKPITQLQATLAQSPHTTRAMSPYDFLKKINQWDQDLDPEHYKLPDNTQHAQQLLDLLEPEDKTELDRLATSDGQHIRVSAILNTMNSNNVQTVVTLAQQAIQRLPEPLTAHTTGISIRLENMQKDMVTTQIKTFSLAFILVFIAILIGLRSFRLMLIAILPNLAPILTVFTTMYLLNISLDPATVMVASIALGIAVDDTLHLLTAIQNEQKRGIPTPAAIQNALTKVGASITVTTITATIGFITLSTSAFIPVAYFGLLSGITMVAALIADFLIIPALYSFVPKS